MKFKLKLTENLGVKLIAVIVAIFIWFNASGQQEVTRVRSIPVVVAGLPDSLTITGPMPTEVEISVRGTKRQLLTMGLKRVQLTIDLSGVQPGRQRISLTSNDIQLPGGFDRRQVSVLSPVVVDLEVERLVTRRVPVVLTTVGAVPENLVLVGKSVTVEPQWTSIRGASSRVESVGSVSTAPLDLSRVRSSFERELSLEFDRAQFVCDPAKVTVSLEVSEKARRVLANIPPTVLVDSEDYIARVFPRTVSLTLEGAAGVLDTLSSGDVSVLLDLSGRSPDRYRLAPEVILPPGVGLAAMSADTLTVQISRGGAAEAP